MHTVQLCLRLLIGKVNRVDDHLFACHPTMLFGGFDQDVPNRVAGVKSSHDTFHDWNHEDNDMNGCDDDVSLLSCVLNPDSTFYHCGVSDDQLECIRNLKILRSCIKKGLVVACFLFYSVFQNFKARIRYNHIENMAVLRLAMAPHCQVASSSCLLDRHFDTFPHAS